MCAEVDSKAIGIWGNFDHIKERGKQRQSVVVHGYYDKDNKGFDTFTKFWCLINT